MVLADWNKETQRIIDTRKEFHKLYAFSFIFLRVSRAYGLQCCKPVDSKWAHYQESEYILL